MKPALILGGRANTLAACRSLVEYGVPTYVSIESNCYEAQSRYVSPAYLIPEGCDKTEYWRRLLLERQPKDLDGCVIICASDEAIEFSCESHAELRARYCLEEYIPELRRDLLDKHKTLEFAAGTGLSVPKHRRFSTVEELDLSQVRLPILVKPVYSHIYQREFCRKLSLFHHQRPLIEHLAEVERARLDVMLCEYIPGPDELLCSYYGYFDDSGESLFHFTKRVLRRYPKNFGPGTYHVVEWLPEVANAGERFFKGIGYRGLCNIEFKRDARDGELKIIECNPRITGAHALLIEAGLDTSRLVYDVACERSRSLGPTFVTGKALIDAELDLHAFFELHALGELSLGSWLRSLFARRLIFQLFAFTDPLPGLAAARDFLARGIRRAFSKLSSGGKTGA